MAPSGTGARWLLRAAGGGRWPRALAGVLALGSSPIVSDGPRGAPGAVEQVSQAPAGRCGRQGLFQVCVREVRDRKRIDDPLTGASFAPQGRAFKLVLLSVSNEGPSEHLVLAHSDFRLVDPDGARYAPDTGALYFACADAGYRMLPLARSVDPRGTVEGWLVFELPADVKDGTWLETHISFLGSPIRIPLRVAEARR